MRRPLFVPERMPVVDVTGFLTDMFFAAQRHARAVGHNRGPGQSTVHSLHHRISRQRQRDSDRRVTGRYCWGDR